MLFRSYVVFAKMLSIRRPEKYADGVGSGWSDAFMLWANQVRATADIFARDDARFSRSRFYAACGVQEGEL